MSPVLRPLAAAVVTLGLLAGCGGELDPDQGEATPAATVLAPLEEFTSAAGAEHGDVLSDTPIDAGDLPAQASRIEYASTSVSGEPITVTGLLVVPEGEPPDGGWPILSWAHGTSGIADACAPSLFGTGSIPLLTSFLGQGWAVVATDYEGLGTPGIHPYLVLASEGRSVLDAARAARGALGPDASDRVALAGYSQGGHAALGAAELAASWTPELDVVAAAAFAPAADLVSIVSSLFTAPEGLVLGALVAAGFPAAAPELDAGDLLTDAGLAVVARAETDACVADLGNAIPDATVDELIRARPDQVEGWAAALAVNSIRPDAIPVPVVIGQGGADPLITPELTGALVEGLCAAGVPVTLLAAPEGDHGTIIFDVGDDVVAALADLFDGVEPPSAACAP